MSNIKKSISNNLKKTILYKKIFGKQFRLKILKLLKVLNAKTLFLFLVKTIHLERFAFLLERINF
jgi:hypothetical protein